MAEVFLADVGRRWHPSLADVTTSQAFSWQTLILVEIENISLLLGYSNVCQENAWEVVTSARDGCQRLPTSARKTTVIPIHFYISAAAAYFLQTQGATERVICVASAGRIFSRSFCPGKETKSVAHPESSQKPDRPHGTAMIHPLVAC